MHLQMGGMVCIVTPQNLPFLKTLKSLQNWSPMAITKHVFKTSTSLGVNNL